MNQGMVYTVIGVAIIIVGAMSSLLSYLIYRKRRATQPSRVPEAEASETPPESAEIVAEAEEVPPAASEVPPGAAGESSETAPEAGKTTPPVVHEISSLPDSARNKLMNAVWYRCENPRCNYTHFLDVHHIVSEVEGGSNRLDNLIVLCPACHAAADSHKTSERKLRSWILDRQERFKEELDWPYK